MSWFKRSVMVEARQFGNNNDNAEIDKLTAWVNASYTGCTARHDGTDIYIITPAGEIKAEIKDWIVKDPGCAGVAFRVCKPDEFADEYELVEA